MMAKGKKGIWEVIEVRTKVENRVWSSQLRSRKIFLQEFRAARAFDESSSSRGPARPG
jgi:hypothetical protein